MNFSPSFVCKFLLQVIIEWSAVLFYYLNGFSHVNKWLPVLHLRSTEFIVHLMFFFFFLSFLLWCFLFDNKEQYFFGQDCCCWFVSFYGWTFSLIAFLIDLIFCALKDVVVFLTFFFRGVLCIFVPSKLSLFYRVATSVHCF